MHGQQNIKADNILYILISCQNLKILCWSLL